ncbi:hypothetical protein [Glycomyces sp. NRRL B-16210]|uniref:hypothetical protein n=1 Tax=Glycomyces sp. NRRL B-16210 TaxID=1463821 RepID=UPI001414F90F|nr:hypothetical protein [Glycomyces sp. NRRL B-16210]
MAATAVALALGRIDGVSIDRVAFAAVRQPRCPIAAGQADVQSKRALRRVIGRRPEPSATKPVRGPVRAVNEDGLIDLGPAGWAAAVDIGFVNFGLRSTAEQTVLCSSLGRLLCSTDAHVQICLSTRPVDLSSYLESLAVQESRLRDGLLQAAASAHRSWLSEVVGSRQLLRREITVIVRCASADAVHYATRQVRAMASGIGVSSRLLDRSDLAARVRYGIDPYGSPARTE